MEKSSEESNQKKTLVERHHKYSIEQKIKIVNEIEETSLMPLIKNTEKIKMLER